MTRDLAHIVAAFVIGCFLGVAIESPSRCVKATNKVAVRRTITTPVLSLQNGVWMAERMVEEKPP